MMVVAYTSCKEHARRSVIRLARVAKRIRPVLVPQHHALLVLLVDVVRLLRRAMRARGRASHPQTAGATAVPPADATTHRERAAHRNLHCIVGADTEAVLTSVVGLHRRCNARRVGA